ncbi:MAG: hypothetical protein LBK12_07540 [Odoribacteraceae bacterium]|jgi:hypothetical protein|nr:hypothetical protein [Odoribacteraceae bacterium]
MKRYITRALLCATFLAAACARDLELGEITAPDAGYTLPQGRSDADDRIVALYNKYGSYFLYDYSRRDLIWTLAINSTLAPYQCTPPDVARVGDFLDFIEDVWLDFYPDEFLEEFLPYKVFLADTVKQVLSNATYYRFSRTGANQIALAFCSDTLLHLTPATKLEYKIWLQRQLWADIYVDRLDIPEEYFAITDYTKVTSADPASPDYYLARGFFQNIGSMYSMSHHWDLYYFFWNVMSWDYATLETTFSFDNYPLLKRKYDMLRAFFIQRYGVDIRAITDATYN